jgi:hypothetical protein
MGPRLPENTILPRITRDENRPARQGFQGVELCVSVNYNFSAFGEYSGMETIGLSDGSHDRVNVTLKYQYGVWNGAILPRYQILAVDYAPPGSQSTVTYGANFIRGGSNSIASSFSNGILVTV